MTLGFIRQVTAKWNFVVTFEDIGMKDTILGHTFCVRSFIYLLWIFYKLELQKQINKFTLYIILDRNKPKYLLT